MLEDILDELVMMWLLHMAGDTMRKCGIKTRFELLQLDGYDSGKMEKLLTGYNEKILEGTLDDIPLRALSLLVAIEFTKIQVGNRNN